MKQVTLTNDQIMLIAKHLPKIDAYQAQIRRLKERYLELNEKPTKLSKSWILQVKTEINIKFKKILIELQEICELYHDLGIPPIDIKTYTKRFKQWDYTIKDAAIIEHSYYEYKKLLDPAHYTNIINNLNIFTPNKKLKK